MAFCLRLHSPRVQKEHFASTLLTVIFEDAPDAHLRCRQRVWLAHESENSGRLHRGQARRPLVVCSHAASINSVGRLNCIAPAFRQVLHFPPMAGRSPPMRKTPPNRRCLLANREATGGTEKAAGTVRLTYASRSTASNWIGKPLPEVTVLKSAGDQREYERRPDADASKWIVNSNGN